MRAQFILTRTNWTRSRNSRVGLIFIARRFPGDKLTRALTLVRGAVLSCDVFGYIIILYYAWQTCRTLTLTDNN